MSPFRWDVLFVAFLLALPVLLLGMHGDLSAADMTARLPWCLLGGWVVVGLIRWAATPPTVDEAHSRAHANSPLAAEPVEQGASEHEPAPGH
jgi:hypothetical protein